MALIEAMTLESIRQSRLRPPHLGCAPVQGSEIVDEFGDIARRFPPASRRRPHAAGDGAGHPNLLRAPCLSIRPTEADYLGLNKPAAAGQPLGEGTAPGKRRRLSLQRDLDIAIK
jgi:hypothetical protein